MKQNDNRPLMVSIKCITYNHEPFIRQCLEGFVMQKTNFRFEAIVHDDASTDGTAAIIREYAEKYPDIIKPIYETENQYSKHDGSLKRIMNAHMHGKYIATCEGDDYWTDPLKLQKQVDFLERHPDYGAVYTAFKGYNQATGEFVQMRFVPRSGWQYEAMMEDKLDIWTLTTCYRRELGNAVPSLSPVKYFTGDRLLFLTITSKTKVYCLPEQTAVYRILEESASHFTDKLKSSHFMARCMRTHEYFLNHGPKIAPAVERRVRGNIARCLTGLAYKSKNRQMLNEIHFPLYSICNIRGLVVYLCYLLGKSPLMFKLISKHIGL